MTENNKKRTSSFRKIFPNLFFSHKSKDKTVFKESSGGLKGNAENSVSNQYHDLQSVLVKQSEKNESRDENIYENLAIHQCAPISIEKMNDVASYHSSSSTLVSESVKNKSLNSNEGSEPNNQTNYIRTQYTARPQVPRKPHEETLNIITNKMNYFTNSQYPDVYYHSLEKITDKIATPLDEIDIYINQASKVQADPAPVGAEIKKVSTKFLISPKKEAEVRTIQPNRARSLSLDKSNQRTRERSAYKQGNVKENIITKSYNYSAPTSPMPIHYKIPNMPKTVSPYEHVRKTMTETEEKRNSLNRINSNRHKSTPSPRLATNKECNKMSHTTSVIEPAMLDTSTLEKEKTRQKVEAFYWQKLKEQKHKEDEYLLRQSINSSLRSPVMSGNVYSNSTCSSQNSFVVEPKSYSLPRGKELGSNNSRQPMYYTSPFVRGAPERRTDSFLATRDYSEEEIVYRHPEKILVMNCITPMTVVQDKNQMPKFQRGYTTHESQITNQQPKRVNFEEHFSRLSQELNNDNTKKEYEGYKEKNTHLKPATENESSRDSLTGNWSRVTLNVPPRPPVRTTSVNTAGRTFTNSTTLKTQMTGRPLLYSESESGSEAGEIQRILLNNLQREQEPATGGDVSELLDGSVDAVAIEDVAGPSSMATLDIDAAVTDVTDTAVTANAAVTDTSAIAVPSLNVEPLLSKNVPTESEPTDSAMNSVLLDILGDDPTICNTYGPEVHKDLAIRLEHIATNGLTKEQRKEIHDKYLLPENCKLINAPTLNAEIKAAVGEMLVKRDKNIELRQKQTAIAIACLSQAINKLLSSNNVDPSLVKTLMDTERILCDSQYSDSTVRRNFILSSLKKDMNEQLRNTRPDNLLFGQNLSETIKTAKAINKSGADLKTPARKPQVPVTNKKPPVATNTTKNLNWKGPYPARKPPNPPKTTDRLPNRKPPSNSSRASQHQPPRNRR